MIRQLVCVTAVVLAFGLNVSAGPMVNESARKIPIAYDVDVVVVGGSTGAVAAAVAAANAGKNVFLAAPHPYLGEDMTATLRLWLKKNETPTAPLAKAIYSDPQTPEDQPDPNRLPFTYTTDRSATARHPETATHNRLTDGQWFSSSQQSVQFDGDVNILADLKTVQSIERLRVMAFRRDSLNDGFDVAQIAVEASSNGKTWAPLTVLNEAQDNGNERITFSAAVKASVRYLKFAVKKTEPATRVLLGEIEVLTPASHQTATDRRQPRPPRPMHVKKTLDDALLAAGVEFLYNCYATDVVTDNTGQPCGIVMANRAGRQAVIARSIIDATDRAIVARIAGAQFRPYPAGKHTFQRVVIGGEPQTIDQASVRVIKPSFLGPFPNAARTSSGEFQIIEYTLHLPVSDAGYAARAIAEQQARTLTYHPEQQFTSDELFEVPPDSMHGQTSVTTSDVMPVANLPIGAFQPANVPHIYVLGGCADVPRAVAAKLLRPVSFIDLGERLGKVAAAVAESMPHPTGAQLRGKPSDSPVAEGDVREILRGIRPTEKRPTLRQMRRAIPVLGRYDVVVIGGGTAGAPAGIGSGRQGAKTLVVEQLHELGGVGTAGYISKYYWGNRVGFTATLPSEKGWVPEQKAEWWRKANLDADTQIWFGCIGCGAFVENNRVVGAVVTTPFGRGVVLANMVIDTTGNADIAAAAGAKTQYTDETEFGMQGTGLPPRGLGATYTNTDFSIVDETDLKDVWHFYVYAKNKYASAFDQGQLIDTRERRRIVGEYTITFLDEVLGRTYPDTIVRAYSNFDTHGYTIDPLFEISHPDKRGFYVNVPLRCNIPKGFEGILVGGLGVSAHRDAIPLIRMQPDMQNQGYALGVAAAMVAKSGTLVHALDVNELQEHLVEIGNLPDTVLTDVDSAPPSDEQLVAAVANLSSLEDVAVVLACADRALTPLRDAYAAAPDDDSKLKNAHMLALLGDDTGLDTLIDAVASHKEWDTGWDYRGMGQFGSAFSPLDTLIVAMGRTHNRKAVPVILEKLKQLSAADAFSHDRACALALELIGDPAAARPLADVLHTEGMMGYVHDTLETASRRDKASAGRTNAVQTRRDSLRELLLARALFRCGDYEKLGEQILRAYTKDLRGHLARHAQAVLDAGK